MMGSPAAIPISTAVSANAGFRDALRGAIEHVTWRVAATTLAIAIALEAWAVMGEFYGGGDPRLPLGEAYLSTLITNLLMAFCIMFATLVADQRVAKGARRLSTYGWSVVAGCAIAALAQLVVHQWLHLRTHLEAPGIAYETAVMQPAFVFVEYLIWGSIIVFIYVNRRGALLAAARMNAAQMQRAETQRRTLESRLQALQARVEPQFLFNTLAAVRELYASDPAKGRRMLGDLIVYLRAALPNLRESTSALGKEVDLVSAYLGIMQVRFGEHFAFHVDVPETARAARMPAMVMLPLIDHALVHGLSPLAVSRTIDIAAHSAGGKLRVVIADSGQGFAVGAGSDDLHDIQAHLQALYGGEWTLAYEPSGRDGTRVILEIPG